VYPFGKTHGLRDWYEGEHLHYNEAFPNFKSTNYLFLGEGNHLASLQSYHTVHWMKAFAGVPAPKSQPLIFIKDLDFYILKDGKIWYNWCMVDVIGILQQGGYHVLPPAPLPNGINYLPPRAMNGIPSPDSQYVNPGDAEVARKAFRHMLEEDFVKQSRAARWWADDLQWCGPAGVGDARSPDEYVQHFLVPLHAAFPQQKLEIGSSDCEGNYCGALFYLVGYHKGTWLGQPATGRRVVLKFGMHARIDVEQEVDGCGRCGRIVDAWVQLDIPEAFSQMGVDLLGRAKAQHSQLLAAEEPKGVGQQQVLAVVPLTKDVPDASAGATAFVCCIFGFLAGASFQKFLFTKQGSVVQQPLLE
jgi:predicted ester cyclase